MKSESIEDYIKAIYQIQEQQNGEPVSTSSLSEKLNVANGSVTGMLKRIALSDAKLINYEPYAGVTLTQAGERMALEVIRHHRLIESFLSQMLGYRWDEVHEEAERLEHVISEAMEERIADALGHPIIDPHGDPIPDREGNLISEDTIPLTALGDKQSAKIQRVTGQAPDLLRYLADLGLLLSTEVLVVSKSPFNGPINITIRGDSGEVIGLSREVTDKILVIPLPNVELELQNEQSRK